MLNTFTVAYGGSVAPSSTGGTPRTISASSVATHARVRSCPHAEPDARLIGRAPRVVASKVTMVASEQR